ncbi:hypothetical protein GCM10007389_04040 [Pontibacter akesuensis]|nr:hypothetical protein GCM10007389_04040 [Pontibacter akesuensis]
MEQGQTGGEKYKSTIGVGHELCIPEVAILYLLADALITAFFLLIYSRKPTLAHAPEENALYLDTMLQFAANTWMQQCP